MCIYIYTYTSVHVYTYMHTCIYTYVHYRQILRQRRSAPHRSSRLESREGYGTYAEQSRFGAGASQQLPQPRIFQGLQKCLYVRVCVFVCVFVCTKPTATTAKNSSRYVVFVCVFVFVRTCSRHVILVCVFSHLCVYLRLSHPRILQGV